jgi:uncharacterized protein YbjT (DUF2867 family)
MAYKVIIAGASGLIGSNLLHILLQHQQYNEVIVLVRKQLPVKHQKLKQVIIDFDKLEEYKDFINGHALFCCLGTTKKQTPNETQYRKIDHDYPLTLAKISKENGVEQLHLVSAIGANKRSSFFYTKLKGELEEDIKKIGIPALHIYQPSMLIGERQEKRPLEKLIGNIFKAINPLLIGGLKKYKSVQGVTVAYAMFKKSLDTATGTFIYTSDKINSI